MLRKYQFHTLLTALFSSRELPSDCIALVVRNHFCPMFFSSTPLSTMEIHNYANMIHIIISTNIQVCKHGIIWSPVSTVQSAATRLETAIPGTSNKVLWQIRETVLVLPLSTLSARKCIGFTSSCTQCQKIVLVTPSYSLPEFVLGLHLPTLSARKCIGFTSSYTQCQKMYWFLPIV